MRFLIGLCAGGLLTAAALLDPAQRATAIDAARDRLGPLVAAARAHLDDRIEHPPAPAAPDRRGATEAGGAVEATPAVPATDPEPAAAAPAPSPVETPPSVATVWIPFRSEMSATGFAERLGRALDHPFDVRREGPGAYQVVFPYDDAREREALLEQVAAVTGARP
jgi:hypothetical protein